jgi:hypothetical protein
VHQTFGPEATADVDDRPRPSEPAAETIDETELVDDYEWDAFLPDPEEDGSEEAVLQAEEDDELDLDDSEFDWEGALDDDAEVDPADVARVEAAFDRMLLSVERTYADEEPPTEAAPGTRAEEDAHEDPLALEAAPEFQLLPENVVLGSYEEVAVERDAEPEADLEEDELELLIPDAEAWSPSTPDAEAEVEVEVEAEAEETEITALRHLESDEEEAHAVGAGASIDVDDWNEIDERDDPGDGDELLHVDDRSSAETRLETSVEDDVIAAFARWVAENEDVVGEEVDLPEPELVDVHGPYDIERDDDRAALIASGGTALLHGPEQQADEEWGSTDAWDDEQRAGEGHRSLDDQEDVQWAAFPSVQEPEHDDESWVATATNGEVHAAADDLIVEPAHIDELIHPEFAGEEVTVDSTPLPEHATGVETRRSPVFRGAIVVGCVFLALIAGAGIVRALHQSASEPAGSTATTAPAASASVAEARLRAATDTADSATTTAQAELAALPGIPTPAKVGAVVNQYIASLQLYETFLTGASVPVVAQTAARAVASQIQGDLAFFTTINGIAPADLGAYLNRFSDGVGHLQSSLSTLEQALRGP